MKKFIKSGFTLIELLVVITIIGILATGGVSLYTSQIQKARDSTRISDIKALQSAIEQAYQNTSTFPDNATTPSLKTAISENFVQIPGDPKQNQNGCRGATAGTFQVCDYLYIVAASSENIDHGAYELSTAFESIKSAGTATSDTTATGKDDTRYELFNGNTGLSTAQTSPAVSVSCSTTTAGLTRISKGCQ